MAYQQGFSGRCRGRPRGAGLVFGQIFRYLVVMHRQPQLGGKRHQRVFVVVTEVQVGDVFQIEDAE